MKKVLFILGFILVIGIGIYFTSYFVVEKESFWAKVKEEIVIIPGNADYDVRKNIDVKGGSVTCVNDVLIIGENQIKCIAQGKDDDVKDLEYTLIKSSTYNKNIIYFGDSITAGFLGKPQGYSWVNYIQDHYDLASSVNSGVTDYRVSPYDDKNKWLVSLVEKHYQDGVNYDFVIMQGGINDVFYDTPMGIMSESFDKKDFDVNTFIGGLETYLDAVITKWPDARIGYIITYFTPKYTERNIVWTYDDYKTYVDATIKVLDKWHVPYLNLFEEEYHELLKVYNKTYLPDYLHLNNAGYEKIAPYIYDWLQTINIYSEK